MTELWVARDADGDVWMFGAQPERCGGDFHAGDDGSVGYINSSLHHIFNIKPGECRSLVVGKGDKRMKLDPNAPAYPGYSDPLVTADDGTRHLRSECGLPQEPSMGLTVRQHFAAMAMQGAMAADTEATWPTERLVQYAVKVADALIAELNKEQA